ncbi:hypothetical protein THER_1721 [Thermodesulfovibrio sp. N1]|nr:MULTISPECIES: hypothetical protein [unclassified Thermodesulfovibrio]MDI1471508.1 hypothetical protein [Thermodesulfovibrio sp. 1176]ODA43558.1 hypothetical protein THER_1721 [Thermodesulfovibrio sp. N1]
MIKQTILSFKLSHTKDEITVRADLAVYDETLKGDLHFCIPKR